MIEHLNDRAGLEEICHAYFYAKKIVIKNGYSGEIDWQREINFEEISEQYFLKQTGWVILSSGMSEKVIAQKFPHISEAFYNWESAKRISRNRTKCYSNAFCKFSHEDKISAIISAADIIVEKGFHPFKEQIRRRGIDVLELIPFIGTITKHHLAKNIGLDISKPDRHLERISNQLGFDSSETLCSSIAKKINEKKSVVDLVIWRYATLNNNYLEKIDYFLTRKPFNF